MLQRRVTISARYLKARIKGIIDKCSSESMPSHLIHNTQMWQTNICIRKVRILLETQQLSKTLALRRSTHECYRFICRSRNQETTCWAQTGDCHSSPVERFRRDLNDTLGSCRQTLWTTAWDTTEHRHILYVSSTLARARLWSGSSLHYEKPRMRLQFSHWAFSYAALVAWNTLPLHLQQMTNTHTFKTHPKGHLFQFAYP